MTIPTKWAVVAALVLGLVGVASAKKNKSDNGGIKGKIISMSTNMIIIKEGGKKSAAGPQQVKISLSPSTTVEIDGTSGKRVLDLQAGESVVVLEDQNGMATDIQAKSRKSGGRRAK